MTEREQQEKNREIIDALRSTLENLLQRLAPDVEPAVTYELKEKAE